MLDPPEEKDSDTDSREKGQAERPAGKMGIPVFFEFQDPKEGEG